MGKRSHRTKVQSGVETISKQLQRVSEQIEDDATGSKAKPSAKGGDDARS